MDPKDFNNYRNNNHYGIVIVQLIKTNKLYLFHNIINYRCIIF